MTIQAVVFDIGGVLEITPSLGVAELWEARLGLPAGTINERMADVWSGGGIGAISEADVHRVLADRLGLEERQVNEFMDVLWREYLGSANTELIEYARRLRPRYRTGILSNSFVGAREREQAAYDFENLVDEIIYSHECGLSKPDPAIYALACARLRVRPEQMVFLDDNPPNVEGARQAGIHAVLYQDNAQAIRDTEALLALFQARRTGFSSRGEQSGRTGSGAELIKDATMVSHDPQLEWKTRREEPVVRTPWFQVGLADLELPDGRRIDHYLFRLPPVVLTAMQGDQDRVLLILRFRFIPGTWGWELPSGLADPGEDFAAAAVRETLKETGWEPESPRLLMRLEASAGLTDSVHHVYRTSRARQRGVPGFETVRMEWFPLSDMTSMIASGEIRAASTSAAVLMIGNADQ
jgi:putative hydrolase of the HAD superfamily